VTSLHDPVTTREPVTTRDPAPAPGSTPARPAARIAVLDGLRLVAALMVVGFHYTVLAPGQWGIPTEQMFPHVHRVTAYGRLGVELFFLISGFVICMSAWGRGLAAFVTSRVTRLYPAYWFAVLATAAALNLFGHGNWWWDQHVSLRDLLVNLAMLQAPIGVRMVDGVYWTLWLELHFYLLFAIVVWRGLTYRRVVMFCVLWLTASVLIPGTAPPTPTWPQAPLDSLIDSNHAPFFVAGVVLYLMHRFRPTILLWGLLGVCYALALNQVALIAVQHTDSTHHALRNRPGSIIMTGMFAIMIAVALGWLNWVRGRWLTIAGALTYPVYLLHDFIGWLVIGRLHDRVPKWPLLIGLVAGMLVAAWLVHRLVERPLAGRLKPALTAALQAASVDRQPPRSG
jgi:peptidoglycan/LPS O-acetylase OafA/YrhL